MRFNIITTSKICLAILCLLLGTLAVGSPQFGGATFCMKKIPLTRGYFALVDDADFDWLNQWKWHSHPGRQTIYACASGSIAGFPKHARMHRVILSLKDKTPLVDHKDRNGLNNQRVNLRECNPSQNSANMRRSHAWKTSKYHGVYQRSDTKKWAAQIVVNGKNIKLGSKHLNEEDAARAYNDKAILVFGEFANLNNV